MSHNNPKERVYLDTNIDLIGAFRTADINLYDVVPLLETPTEKFECSWCKTTLQRDQEEVFLTSLAGHDYLICRRHLQERGGLNK